MTAVRPYAEIMQYIDAHQDDMIAMWKELVETPGSSRNRKVAMQVERRLAGIFRDMGLDVTEHDVGPVNSCLLEAVWGRERTGKPVLFGGHYDTVEPCPAFGNMPGSGGGQDAPGRDRGEDAPDVRDGDGTAHFRIENGRAHGLGVLDMKGGIVIAIWVIKALQAAGWKERPVRILLAGDEGKGHADSTTAELLTRLASGALVCFNMETGRMSGEICVARRGVGDGIMLVHGVAAHAGNDYLRGRNAVVEAAHKVIEAAALTRLDAGTTVSPTIIQGGQVPNGIPGECRIIIDTRYTSPDEKIRIMEGLQTIAEKNSVQGTRTDFRFEEYMGPFAETPDTDALADFLSEESEKLGLGAMGRCRLGGTSDATYFQAAGVPTVCAVGVRGEFNHTCREYAVVDSLFERAKLLACATLDLDAFGAGQG